MASRPPCSACARSTSTPRNFLLVCACGSAWHHRCLDPPMEDHTLLAMISASNLSAQTTSIRAWRCYECEGGRARALTNWRDDFNSEESYSGHDISPQISRRRASPESKPVWPPRRRKRETQKLAEGGGDHFKGNKRGHAASIFQSGQMTRRFAPMNNTELVPAWRRACSVSQSPVRYSPSPVSVQMPDNPSHPSLPLVDLDHMLSRKRREVAQRSASHSKSPPAKKRRTGDRLSSRESVASGASTAAHKDHISAPGASDVAMAKSEDSTFSKTSSGSSANKSPFNYKTSSQKPPRETTKRRKAQKVFLFPTQIRRIRKTTRSPSPGFEAGKTIEASAPSTGEITTHDMSNHTSLPANVALPQPEILSNDAAKSVSTHGPSQVSQTVAKQDKVCEESGTGTCSPQVSASELATLNPPEGVGTADCVTNSQESPEGHFRPQSTPVENTPISHASSPSERTFTNHGDRTARRNSLLPELARWFSTVAEVQHRPITRRGRTKGMAQMRLEEAEWSFVAR